MVKKCLMIIEFQPRICLDDWGKTRKQTQLDWSAPRFQPETSQIRVQCVTTAPPRSEVSHWFLLLWLLQTYTACSKMMDGVLSSWYCFTNESGCVILSYNGRRTVKVFMFLTQRFCFSSLLRRCVKFLKWRLQCISHFVCCSLQLLQVCWPSGTQTFVHGNATYISKLWRSV